MGYGFTWVGYDWTHTYTYTRMSGRFSDHLKLYIQNLLIGSNPSYNVLNKVSKCIGLATKSAQVFHKTLWKNLNEFFWLTPYLYEIIFIQSSSNTLCINRLCDSSIIIPRVSGWTTTLMLRLKGAWHPSPPEPWEYCHFQHEALFKKTFYSYWGIAE